jgi:hypothetical protein
LWYKATIKENLISFIFHFEGIVGECVTVRAPAGAYVICNGESDTHIGDLVLEREEVIVNQLRSLRKVELVDPAVRPFVCEAYEPPSVPREQVYESIPFFRCLAQIAGPSCEVASASDPLCVFVVAAWPAQGSVQMLLYDGSAQQCQPDCLQARTIAKG